MNRAVLALAVVTSTLAIAGETSAQAATTAGPGLESATADVSRVAPRLEQYYFVHGYPRDLDGAKASMRETGLTLSKGNELGGYRFKDSEREFILCVQDTSGAFATYDTAPMATGISAERGGCPAKL
jgi:hypothetical protein